MLPREKAQVAFASGVAVLFLSAVAAYFAIGHFRATESWVEHTYQVQASLGELDATLSRAARIRNSYLAAPDDSLFAAFEVTVPEIQEKLQTAAKLTQDNPRQRDLAAQLQNTTMARIAKFRSAMQLKKISPKDAAGLGEISRADLSLAFDRAEIMDQMRNEEDRLLQLRTADSNQSFFVSVVILAMAFVFALTLFSVNYGLLNRELRAREQAEKAARQNEESLRHLTARLQHMQDEERRKFSRELHDSLGQYLAGIKMNLDVVTRSYPENDLILEAIELLDQSIIETRTISHLLHPPLLDEVGFSSAAKWYLQGFSERSGLDVKFEIPGNLGRLPKPLELVLFRVLQESLTNIHRHSKSSKAEVTLTKSPGEVVLRVRDHGNGIPPDLLNSFQTNGTNGGVGLSGMRERVRELGGRFEIDSGRAGTTVSVTFPLLQQAQPIEAISVS